MLNRIRHLWKYAFRADTDLLDAVAASREDNGDVLREFAHIVGAEETWLSRLEGRVPRCPVWPDGDFVEIERLLRETHRAFEAYLAALGDDDLGAEVTYTNSAGRTFTNTVADILLHVVLHSQYHRGKVNLLLRQAGQMPAPADYIAFVRGAAAATESDALRDRPAR